MVWLQGAIIFFGILFLLQRPSEQDTGASQRYHLVKNYLSWYEAQTFCRVKYNDLATVNDLGDVSELVKALEGHWSFSWIGLRKGGSNRWMWSDGSGVATFFKWNDGEPSGHEWCVELSETGGWNDYPCHNRNDYVCYERQSNGEESYIYYTTERTYMQSQEYCRSRHTDLAYIYNDQDNSDVINVIKTWYGSLLLENRASIGLFSDSWMWSDGSQTSFRYWLDDKASREDCASVSGPYEGRWVDAQCEQQATFVCEGDFKEKKMVVRMTVRSDADLNNYVISGDLLSKLESSLKLQSLSDFTLSWRRDKTGLIFQRHVELKEDVEKGSTSPFEVPV